MSWTENCAIPLAHHDIIAILETVRARAIADTFLTLLEFLQKAEITRYWEQSLIILPFPGSLDINGSRTFGHRWVSREEGC